MPMRYRLRPYEVTQTVTIVIYKKNHLNNMRHQQTYSVNLNTALQNKKMHLMSILSIQI